MAHISIATSSTPAMPPPSTIPTQLATGGAIPERPPPGLPSPPVTSGQDNLRAPSALHTQGQVARDAGTTVLDTVLLGPATRRRGVCVLSLPQDMDMLDTLMINSVERCRRQWLWIYWIVVAYQLLMYVPLSLPLLPVSATSLKADGTCPQLHPWICRTAMHTQYRLPECSLLALQLPLY